MINNSKCHKCRRAGEKLFLKGDKCFSPKCPFIERPFAPGMLDSDKKHRSPVSEYGQQLKEKQKLRNIYGLTEKQLSSYVENIPRESKKMNVVPQLALISIIEKRLDNIVYRLGFANSRSLARQMVSHGHILVNSTKVTVPSMIIKPEDIISIREGSKTIKPITTNIEKIKSNKISFASSNGDLSYKINSLPNDLTHPLDIAKVLEFYSR